MFSFFKTLTETLWGDFGYCVFFFVSLAILFAMATDVLKRTAFMWYSAICFVFIYNPLMLMVARKLLYEDMFLSYYLKLFNVVPVVIIIGYGLTTLIATQSGVKKLVLTFALMGVMVICGRTVYRELWFEKADNFAKVPDEVFELQEVMEPQLAEAKENDDKVGIMVPLDLSVYLRQIEPGFKQQYSRYDWQKTSDYLLCEEPDVDYVYETALGYDMDYVLVKSQDKTLKPYLKNDRFNELGTISNSEYTLMSIDHPEWIMWQCADESYDQGICYILHNTINGSVIVIDGGTAKNGASIHADLKALGGHVDAWIITHYHQDHVGAFNWIMNNCDDITVDTVYDTPLDRDYFLEKAYEWDDVDYFLDYENIRENTTFVKEFLSVNRGDELTLCKDVEIKFFNAYDEKAREAGFDDIGNNCALVFKLSVGEDSILFMSDCHTENMAKLMMDEFGDEMSAKYLQVAHHGNNSVPTDIGFYELIDAEVALFDAPEWLMTGEAYTAKDLKKYLEKNGTEIRWFDRWRHAWAMGE